MAYIKQNINENTDMTPEVFNHMEDGIKVAHDGLATHTADSMYKTTGGTANAQTVDLSGTFDLTKDGNPVFINPSLSNTGAMTLNPDGQGAKAVKKFNIDTNAYVDIEAGDVKKNNPLSLRWDLANGFFVLAPKGGGALIKSRQDGAVALSGTTKDITINAVDPNYTVVISNTINDYGRVSAFAQLINSTTLRFSNPNNFGMGSTNYYSVIELNPALIKSIQFLSVNSAAATTANITAVNMAKSLIIHQSTIYVGTDLSSMSGWALKFGNSTTINIGTNRPTEYSGQQIKFAVIELK